MLSATSLLFRRGFASAAPTTKLFINGKFIESATDKFVDVKNPATNEVINTLLFNIENDLKLNHYIYVFRYNIYIISIEFKYAYIFK